MRHLIYYIFILPLSIIVALVIVWFLPAIFLSGLAGYDPSGLGETYFRRVGVIGPIAVILAITLLLQVIPGIITVVLFFRKIYFGTSGKFLNTISKIWVFLVIMVGLTAVLTFLDTNRRHREKAEEIKSGKFFTFLEPKYLPEGYRLKTETLSKGYQYYSATYKKEGNNFFSIREGINNVVTDCDVLEGTYYGPYAPKVKSCENTLINGNRGVYFVSEGFDWSKRAIYQFRTFRWTFGGTEISVSSRSLSREELLRIVESMQ